MISAKPKAVVLLSGGLDSTTTLERRAATATPACCD